MVPSSGVSTFNSFGTRVVLTTGGPEDEDTVLLSGGGGGQKAFSQHINKVQLML